MKQHESILVALVKLSSDPLIAVKKAVYQSVVNLSTDDELALRLSSLESGTLLSSLLESCDQSTDDDIIQTACMALSNLSRSSQCCTVVWKSLLHSKNKGLEKVVTLACTDKECLHHVGLLLCNLSQLKDVRR